MTKDLLDKSIVLQANIEELSRFIRCCENNRNIKLFRKEKNMGAVVSDYMRAYEYFAVTPNLRLKLIELLKNELKEMEKEFSELN